jgi:HSP20 family protein
MYMPSIFGSDFDDFMDFSFPNISKELYGKRANQVMKTDVREVGENYEVDIDLPGFKKDEIEISLEKGMLTISASKGLDKDEEDKNGKYIRRERYAGSMSRSFYVGDAITFKDIKAKYESGILSITVPKAPKEPVETSHRIAID